MNNIQAFKMSFLDLARSGLNTAREVKVRDSATGACGMPQPDPDRAPILVIGTGRSGTTLLRLLLNAHPRIYLTHEASFYLIRSGLRATVASLLRMPWAASSVSLNSLFCLMRLREIRPFSGRIHEIRLEDLLIDTERVMRGVLEFVGEPFDDAVLDHVHHAPLDDVPPFPWFSTAKSAVRPPTGEPSWMRQLDPTWIRNIEQVHRSTMDRYGYQRAELDPEPGIAARQRARLADLPEI